MSFGVEQLIGEVRVASPSERHSPGLVSDGDSLLLFPEREDSFLEQGYVVDGIEPGIYQRPFRKHTVKLKKDVRVDSFLLQYNPVRNGLGVRNQKFQGELHFDRPIVALILQKNCWILQIQRWLFQEPTSTISFAGELTTPMW